MIKNLSRRVLTGLVSPVRSREEKEAAALCSEDALWHPKESVQIQTPALETVLRCACLDVHLQLTVGCFA